jgi:NAD(P)H-flavin reductase
MPWSLYEHERMTALTQRPWFDYTPVVSDDSSYPGTRGLVGSVAAQSPRREGRRAMVCGSGEMVQHTIGELTRAGTLREEIRFDEFAKAGSGTGDME